MKKRSLAAAGSLGALLVPFLAFAQGTFQGGYILSIFNLVESVLSRLFPIASALVVLYFFYEVYKFMSAAPDKKAEARKGLISSVIAVALVFLIFGVIALLGKITGTDTVNSISAQNVSQVKF